MAQLFSSGSIHAMKYTVGIFLFVLVFAGCSGCTDVHYSDNKSDWYAIIEKPMSGNLDLCIMVTEWTPLLNPSGIGGPREHRLVSVDFDGVGPIYHARSTLTISSKDTDYGGEYEGSLTLDINNRKALVNLKRNAAELGKPFRIVLFPYNGNFKVTKGLENITK